MIEALNDRIVPEVRSLGSVGVADLGPMAELAEALVEGTGFDVAENEGFALINSNAFSFGSAVLAVRAADRLLEVTEVAAALDLEAFGANLDMLHPIVGVIRPYPGLVISLARSPKVAAGGQVASCAGRRPQPSGPTHVASPQIHGAARDALSYVGRIVETEPSCA